MNEAVRDHFEGDVATELHKISHGPTPALLTKTTSGVGEGIIASAGTA
jgi:hypothetical protein